MQHRNAKFRAPLFGAVAVLDPVEPVLPEQFNVEVRLLGGFCASVHGSSIEHWSSQRARSAFKYLVTHREAPVRRETLMAAFWPDAQPESARNNLNVAMHSLRKSLRSAADGHPTVLYGKGAYRLSPELKVWTDVSEFDRQLTSSRWSADDPLAAREALSAAVRLYRGDFFEDDPLQEWAIPEMERLVAAYVAALLELTALDLDAGCFEACSAHAHAALRRDRCLEEAHRLLMLCHARQGRPHLALRQFQACTTAMTQELDTAPSAALTSLRDEIRQHRPV
ncbi:MAG: BTAD domain-containing putative transcriptional regulator [Acidimicrobiales bacterium]